MNRNMQEMPFECFLTLQYGPYSSLTAGGKTFLMFFSNSGRTMPLFKHHDNTSQFVSCQANVENFACQTQNMMAGVGAFLQNFACKRFFLLFPPILRPLPSVLWTSDE